MTNLTIKTQIPDTIAALATSPNGGGAISVFRVSGPQSFEILGKITRDKCRDWRPRQAYHFPYYSEDGERLDHPLYLSFQGPNSFTGEDCFEIHCHSGPYILRSILKDLIHRGARNALPGEFSYRAYINGKMDLLEAEGIAATINAQSHQQWLIARQLTDSKLSERVKGLREDLVEALALLEARIDFPEEGDTSSVNLEDVKGRVRRIRIALKKLSTSYQNGRVASEGLKVVLAGPPNAGKSTLLNTLLGRERAIVTDIAGTTRDFIEERCLLEGRLIRLFDTAGIQESSDRVEVEGIQRSMSLLEDADLVVFLASSETSLSSFEALKTQFKGLEEKLLKVVTKVDISHPSWFEAWLPISCLKDSGIDNLISYIVGKVDEFVAPLQDNVGLCNVRHRDAIEQALGSIDRFFGVFEKKVYEEMLAFDLQECAKYLGEIIGHIDSEDILDQVFGQFCIGK